MITFADPFKLLWLTIRDLFDEMFLLMLTNLVFVLVNLPLFGLALFLYAAGAPIPAGLAAVLAMFVFGPACGGMYTIMERIADGRVAKIGLFFEGFREYMRTGWKIYVPWGIGLALIGINLIFYLQMRNTVGSFLFFTFLYIALLWFALLIYIGPLMILQSDKRLRIVARNAALMVLGRPIFTLLTVIMMGVILAISLWLLLLPILITFAFLADWGFRATLRLIKDAEARREAREAGEAATNGQPANGEKGRGGQVRPRE